jgi:hypothetical protein
LMLLAAAPVLVIIVLTGYLVGWCIAGEWWMVVDSAGGFNSPSYILVLSLSRCWDERRWQIAGSSPTDSSGWLRH